LPFIITEVTNKQHSWLTDVFKILYYEPVITCGGIMRPKTEMGNFFVEDPVLMEEQRLGAIAAQLSLADEYFDSREPLEATPLIAYRLGSGSYSFDTCYRDIFRGGSITEAHITPAYDGYFSEEHPGMVVATRCLRLQVKPKKLPFSRKPLPPAATFYLFAPQADLAEYHTANKDVNKKASDEVQADPDRPPRAEATEPTLDQSRFKQMPQVDAYRFGIVRRSGTIVCYSIEENEKVDTVSMPDIDTANEHVLDMVPGAVTVDRNPERLEPVEVTGKLCGDILRELKTISDLKAPEKRRSWKSLFLKKVIVSPDDNKANNKEGQDFLPDTQNKPDDKDTKDTKKS